MDLVPARMAHEGSEGAQGGGPRHGEEITDGVGIKDRIQHDDVGSHRFDHPDGALAGGGHLGVDGGVAERGGVGDAQRDVGVVEDGQPRGLGAGEGTEVGGVGADGHIEGAGDVGDAAGHRAVGREVDPSGGSGPAARAPGRGWASFPRGRSTRRGSGWSRRRRTRWRAGPCRRRGPPTPRPKIRRDPWMCRTGSAKGRRRRWSCFPSSRTRVCWSCRRRRSRPHACGPRRDRRRRRAGRRRGGPIRRWCESRSRSGGP